MKLRLHFVMDPMGWFCISMVFAIWLYNSFFVPKLVLLPHFYEGNIPWALVVSYYFASALCMAALFRASTADPGRLPPDPQIPHSDWPGESDDPSLMSSSISVDEGEETEREQWEMCTKCNTRRPKRSHHCSRCGHCVRRMDHHCPWINNCVGEDNHWLFLQLCFYTQVLSLFTLALDFCQFYYFQPLTSLDQEAFMARHELALIRVSAIMGLVMIGGMSNLFYTQMAGILTDTTTIEKMSHFSNEIVRSGGGSKKSWQRTLAEVFGTTWKILWFIPLRSRQPLTFPHHFRSHV